MRHLRTFAIGPGTDKRVLVDKMWAGCGKRQIGPDGGRAQT